MSRNISDKWNKKKLYWIKIDYNLDIELFYVENIEITKDIVIINTKHGLETGKVLLKTIPLDRVKTNPNEYPKVVRIASEKDIELRKKNKERVPESFKIAEEKIKEHNLPIKLLHVHHFLDDKKVMFYFYCENRVDFRSLVRDLAYIFKVRIELRQVGVRDEAMFIGGYGVCGRQYCCSLFGTNKDPKSIKMAREQNLTLNSMRISGVCGRLLCCLGFEYNIYHEDSTQRIKVGTEILLNNDILTYVKEVNWKKRYVVIETRKRERFTLPVEGILINNVNGKCYAYI
jgi:cell fate regulator YaaT (PSP1 superfamily)